MSLASFRASSVMALLVLVMLSAFADCEPPIRSLIPFGGWLIGPGWLQPAVNATSSSTGVATATIMVDPKSLRITRAHWQAVEISFNSLRPHFYLSRGGR